jgi:hypothetical protein
MVRLDLRGGAIRRWTTHAWSPTAGPTRCAATPPPWQAFMTAAARLAAALEQVQVEPWAAPT